MSRLSRFFRRVRPEPPRAAVDPAAIVRRARRLKFLVRPEAVAALAGAYHGARPGTGLTFEELRAYEPGDEVRHIDWRVTTRLGRPYVRRFVEERALTLRLVLDVSASLRFGPGGRGKADRAAQASALLAAAAIYNGDLAGLVLVSDRVEGEVPAGGGGRHLARLLRTLIATPAASRRTDLTGAITRQAKRPKRSLLVVLSDFLDTGPIEPWRAAARRHDLVALRLVDPLESDLPEAGQVALADAESPRRILIDAGSPRVRAAYAQAAADRLEAFRGFCDDAGLAGHDLTTADDPIVPLLRLFRGSATSRGRRR